MHVENQQWIFSTEHHQTCQVLDVQSVWGQKVYRVWLPNENAVVRVQSDQVKTLEEATQLLDHYYLSYIAAAGRVADILTQDLLLAPIESSVIPLPHQIRALSRAIFNDRVRYLLADEVGLGKTIEAGLIMRELKLRGLQKRRLRYLKF